MSADTNLQANERKGYTMKRFTQGTEVFYTELDTLLSDGMCHIYNDCELPESCAPKKTRFGFEKDGEVYRVMTDYGIETDDKNSQLESFLHDGEKSFHSITEMMSFFHSLDRYFNTSSLPVNTSSTLWQTSEDVIDLDKLNQIHQSSEQSTRKYVHPDEIACPIKKKIFGQDAAIDGLAHEISAHHLAKISKPLVVMLLGPPATGKTETGKSLSEQLSELYGKKYGFIEIKSNEFLEEHSVARFLGSPAGYTGYGDKTILSPVRDNPYQVILMDEIEKANQKILVALMEALDTGILNQADNSEPIDLRHCIIIFTSNLPVDMKKYDSLNRFEKTELCRNIFTSHCGKPEITRRISEFLVYLPLDINAKAQVIIKFVKRELDNFDAKLGKIDENLIYTFLMLRTDYGASELGNRVRKSLSYKLLDEGNPDLIKGKTIKLGGTAENITIDVMED